MDFSNLVPKLADLVPKLADIVPKLYDLVLKLLLPIQHLLEQLKDLSPLIECWEVLDPSCFSCQGLATIRYAANGLVHILGAWML